jgi:predicted transcriptional regulator of viral defense system
MEAIVDLADYVNKLAAHGRYHFTPKEAEKAISVSPIAIRSAIRRLRKRGIVAMPRRGFLLILPPEYRELGCLPPEQFVPQLMDHLGERYYVGLLSAAQFHGAAHQRPQVFQVVIARNRPPIHCGRVHVQYIARANVARVPTSRINTPRGYVAVSTPEATAYDLVGYSEHCGGFNNVATVLTELSEKLNGPRLAGLVGNSPLPWAQRLGLLLELAGGHSVLGPLAEIVAKKAREYVPLNPRRPLGAAERQRRWKLLVNDRVEADL